MSFPSTPDREIQRSISPESDDVPWSPEKLDQAEELRLAAEMGQLLISQKKELELQKKELQEELGSVKAERDSLKLEVQEWSRFAEEAGEGKKISSSSALSRLRQAESRAEALRSDAAECRQRIVQLEVRCGELESANTALSSESKFSERQALELRKAQEKLKSFSEAAELAASLERELDDMRVKKQQLADKVVVLQADSIQYQEELRISQENLQKVRAECSKLKAVRQSTGPTSEDDADGLEGRDVKGLPNSLALTAEASLEHAKALETIEALKLEIASIRVGASLSAGTTASLKDARAIIEKQKADLEIHMVLFSQQKAEIQSLQAQLAAASDLPERDVSNRAPSWNTTNPFDQSVSEGGISSGDVIEVQFALATERTRVQELAETVRALEETIKDYQKERVATNQERDALREEGTMLRQELKRVSTEREEIEKVGRFLESVNLELMGSIRAIEASSSSPRKTLLGWKRLEEAMTDVDERIGAAAAGTAEAEIGELSSPTNGCGPRTGASACEEPRARVAHVDGTSGSDSQIESADIGRSRFAERTETQTLGALVRRISDGVPAPLHSYVEGLLLEAAALSSSPEWAQEPTEKAATSRCGEEEEGEEVSWLGMELRKKRATKRLRAVQLIMESHFVLTLTGIVMDNPKLQREWTGVGGLKELLQRSHTTPFYEWHAWIRAQLRDMRPGKVEVEVEEEEALLASELNGVGMLSDKDVGLLLGSPASTAAPDNTPQPGAPTLSSSLAPVTSKRAILRSWLTGGRGGGTPGRGGQSEGAIGGNNSSSSRAAGNVSVQSLAENESAAAGLLASQFSSGNRILPAAHMRDLVLRLLQQNMMMTDKLKKSIQRRRALELALEVEVIDKGEAIAHASAVKEVCALLQAKIDEKEAMILELTNGYVPPLLETHG